VATVTNEQFLARIGQGHIVESPDEMSDDYRQTLIHILTVSADTELISAPSYYTAAKNSPSMNNLISALAIIQDELSHAHIGYRILQDLGVDTEALIYDRDPKKFKHPYAFDVPLRSWIELIVANAFYDRAGYVLLGDVYHNCSYGPWRRGLAKVDKEENFHLRHGENGMRRLAPSHREELQAAIDWMFPMTVEWFGLPDSLKTHGRQIGYRLKGSTNDQLRQTWLRTAVPLCESLGFRVPAHHDTASDTYVLDYPLPVDFDEGERRWLMDRPITWDDVLVRWKRRGPGNAMFIEMLQRGRRQMRRLVGAH
jgi:ring-1,2-phenylacetyl-CoA epoxidase subunit PaaA